MRRTHALALLYNTLRNHTRTHRVTEKHTLWLCAATWMFARHVLLLFLTHSPSRSVRLSISLCTSASLRFLYAGRARIHTIWIGLLYTIHAHIQHTTIERFASDGITVCSHAHTTQCVYSVRWLAYRGHIVTRTDAHFLCSLCVSRVVWVASSGSVPDAVHMHRNGRPTDSQWASG